MQTAPDFTTTSAVVNRQLSWRYFWRHFGEMLLAMMLGMMLLGAPLAMVLMAFGTRLSDASVSVFALVMAVEMTIPMIAWMHYRYRMAPARSVEMTASMVLPSLLAIGLHAAGAIGEDAVLVVQHIVMIPAMLAVMLWRREAYSQAC